MDLSEVTQFETKTRLLSELIREGAKLRPQAFGKLVRRMYSLKTHCVTQTSCALAAAYEAKFGRLPKRNVDTIQLCCELGIYPDTAARVINWNDELGMTRETIADRLAMEGS